MIKFRDATHGDLLAIVPHLRQSDAEEWRMGSGKVPSAMVEQDGYRLPSGPLDRNRVALGGEGSPLLLFGVNELSGWGLSNSGWVWLIANKCAPAFYREFVPEWDRELLLLAEAGDYHDFITASWVGNPAHHRWLEAMGFEAYANPFSWGPYGALFQPYRKEA